MKANRFLKNGIIIIIAPFLARGLLFLVNDLSGLTASVLDISEVQKVKDEGWDLAYKTENQIFEIFGSEKVKPSEWIDVEIFYNPDKVNIFPENASGNNFEILKEEQGLLKVKINDINDLKYDQGWFEFPYSGEESQILLGNSWKKEKDEEISLSVGNLNSIQEHSVLP